MYSDETRQADESDDANRPSKEPYVEVTHGLDATSGDEPPPIPVRPFHGLDVLHPDDLDEDEDEDEYDEEEDFDEDDEGDVRAILITGASGHLGLKLRAAWGDVYDLVLIDNVTKPDEADVIHADLGELHEGWITHFHGVDTVIHLAGDPRPDATWEDLERPNLDALANVLHAAALAGVERVIFASSNHVMGGYRELGDMPITVELPPKPDSPYGASKLVGERLGRSVAGAFDVTFVALRLGWIQPGANRPETLPDAWSRGLWLSNGDLVRLFECAVEAELDDNQFVVVNGMSNNRGMRWDLTPGAELLGYSPEDDSYAEEI